MVGARFVEMGHCIRGFGVGEVLPPTVWGCPSFLSEDWWTGIVLPRRIVGDLRSVPLFLR